NTDGRQGALTERGRGERRGETPQGRSMPAERTLPLDRGRACDLVRRLDVLPDDHDLLGRRAGAEPLPGALDAESARRGDENAARLNRIGVRTDVLPRSRRPAHP